MSERDIVEELRRWGTAFRKDVPSTGGVCLNHVDALRLFNLHDEAAAEIERRRAREDGEAVAFVTAWQHVDDGTLEALTADGRIFQWTGQEWHMIEGSDSLYAAPVREPSAPEHWESVTCPACSARVGRARGFVVAEDIGPEPDLSQAIIGVPGAVGHLLLDLLNTIGAGVDGGGMTAEGCKCAHDGLLAMKELLGEPSAGSEEAEAALRIEGRVTGMTLTREVHFRMDGNEPTDSPLIEELIRGGPATLVLRRAPVNGGKTT